MGSMIPRVGCPAVVSMHLLPLPFSATCQWHHPTPVLTIRNVSRLSRVLWGAEWPPSPTGKPCCILPGLTGRKAQRVEKQMPNTASAADMPGGGPEGFPARAGVIQVSLVGSPRPRQ